MPRTTDWRSPDSDDALKNLDRSGVAWEFLRRHPHYREHYAGLVQRIESSAISEEAAITELSRRWGCHFIRDPDLPAGAAPIIWRPELSPLGVTLVAAPDCFPEAHQLAAADIEAASANVQREDGRHLLVRDGQGDHRLWLPDIWIGDKLAGVVAIDDKFALRISGLVRFQRTLTGGSPGPLPKTWEMTRRYRRRLALMLRALDGHLAQASYREIADALYGVEAVTRYAWKTSSIRGQTIRLVKDAVRMMKGGYRKLLRCD